MRTNSMRRAGASWSYLALRSPGPPPRSAGAYRTWPRPPGASTPCPRPPPSPRSSGPRETGGSRRRGHRHRHRGSPRHHPASQGPGRGCVRAGGTRAPGRCGPARGRGHPAAGPAAAGRRGPGLPVPGPDDGPADHRPGPAAGAELHRRAAGPAGRHQREQSTTTRCSSMPTWPRAPPAGWPGRRPSAVRWSTCRPTIAPTTGGCATGTRRSPCTPRTTSRSRTRPAAPAPWPGPGRPSPSSTRPPGSGPTCGARSRWATGSSRSAGTGAGRAGTPAATPRPGPRSDGSRPSTTSTCSRSSGCWPGRPATRCGRSGPPGPGGSSCRCGTRPRAAFTSAPPATA